MDSMVELELIFSNVVELPGVDGPVLGFGPSTSPGDFAKDVGIANAQHLGSLINGRGGRKTCCGWTGARLTPAPAPLRRSRPESPDSNERPAKISRPSPPLAFDAYYVCCGATVLTAATVQRGRSQLLTQDSPAHTRFEFLLPSHPLGVPLELLFPTGRMEGDLLFPMCSTGDFAKDVGIANAQHLASMIRGCGGRNTCSGWRGGVPDSAERIVDVPTAVEMPTAFSHGNFLLEAPMAVDAGDTASEMIVDVPTTVAMPTAFGDGDFLLEPTDGMDEHQLNVTAVEHSITAMAVDAVDMASLLVRDSQATSSLGLQFDPSSTPDCFSVPQPQVLFHSNGVVLHRAEDTRTPRTAGVNHDIVLHSTIQHISGLHGDSDSNSDSDEAFSDEAFDGAHDSRSDEEPDFDSIFAVAGTAMLHNTVSEAAEELRKALEAQDFAAVATLEKELEAAKRLEQTSVNASNGQLLHRDLECVSAIYRRSRPTFLELLEDADPFIVDGDSLLQHALADKHLDWTHGGQMLHASYSFHRILAQLAALKAPFHVVFFESHQPLWHDPCKSLLRTALIQELQLTPADQHSFQKLKIFESLQHPEWLEFVADTAPAFMLVTDAEQAGVTEAALLRCLLAQCLSVLRVSCVFLEDLQFCDGRVSGFIATPAPSNSYTKTKLTNGRLSELIDFLREQLPWVGRAASEIVPSERALELSSPESPAESPRLQLVLDAVAQLVVSEEMEVWMAQAFVLQAAFIEESSLTQRAFKFDTACSPELIQEVVRCLQAAASRMEWTIREQSHPFQLSPTADLLDGRLVCAFARMAPTELAAACSQSHLANRCWQFVLRATGCALEETAPAAAQPRTRPTQSPKPSVEKGPKAPRLVSNALVDAYLQREPRSGAAATAAPAEAAMEIVDTVNTRDGTEGCQLKVADSWDSDSDSEDSEAEELVESWEDEEHDQELVGCPAEAAHAPEIVPFHENKHWHSDLPLTTPLQPAFYAQAKGDSGADADLAEAPFEELLDASNYRLAGKQKGKLQRMLNQIVQQEQGFYNNPKETDSKRRILRDQVRKWLKANRLRQDQQLMNHLQRLSETLTDAKYNRVANKRNRTAKKAKPAKTSTKAAKILQDKQLEDAEKNHGKERERLSRVLARVDKQGNLEDRLKLLELDLKSMDLKAKVVCKRMELWATAWAAGAGSDRAAAMPHAVAIVECVYKAVAAQDALLEFPAVLAHFHDALQVLGYENSIAGLPFLKKRKPRDGIPNLPIGCTVEMSIQRFQLTHMAHLLPRFSNVEPDPRVQSFRPDEWQRELLDAVDRGNSALICAPTSSGKTFIASYVIEKVLSSQDEDSVVVFVLPTKALVNQVQAQIYKDFGTVFGVFTRDVRYRPLSCRVLITVPACLEILTLSPVNREWAQRIKYCIFDEVHCITEQDGRTLERLMLLMTCPIFALSATIGNIDDFHSWIQAGKETQRNQDAREDRLMPAEHYQVARIVHTERWSDLHYSSWCSNPNSEHCNTLVPIHPLKCIDISRVASAGWGAITFTPNECLSIVDGMCFAAEQRQEPDRSALLQTLEWASPDRFFGDSRITHAQTRAYETALKECLRSWACSRPELYHTLTDHLSESGDEAALQCKPPDSRKLCADFPTLLHSLGATNNLPVLVFNFNRRTCLDLMCSAVHELEDAEAARREQFAPELNKAIDKSVRGAKLNQEAARQMERNRSEDQEEDGGMRQPNVKQYFEIGGHLFASDPAEPDPDFSYCSTKDSSSAGSLELIEKLRWPPSDIYIRALRRGIGIHHSGLHTKYRQAVEILFREKHLKVVIATGTLAYGIHMPCSTVVFAGDSVHLSALQFRQMSGRAGRRGFDSIGQIIMYGVSFNRCKRLLLSPVPKLRGRFPVSVTGVLRLLLLHAESTDSRSAFQASKKEQQVVLANSLRTLTNSLLCHSKPENQFSAQLVFGAVIRTLVTLEMVEPEKGIPIGLAGLATHLFWTEPANIGLVHLLRSGVFHKLLRGAAHPTWEIVKVMSYLFCRMYVHPSLAQKLAVEGPSGPSVVILESMPPEVSQALEELQHTAQCTFVQSLQEDIRELGDCPMPFSEANRSSAGERTLELPPGVSQLEPSICSSFVCLSGSRDVFETSEDLVRCSRMSMMLQTGVIPALVPNQERPLNSYILDFCKHGQKKELIRGNSVREGDAWEALKSFDGILRATAASLRQLAIAEPQLQELTPCFEQAATDFHEAFAAFNAPQGSKGLRR